MTLCRQFRIILALALLGAGVASPAASAASLACGASGKPPASLTLAYDARLTKGILDISGETKLTFARKHDQYEFTSETVVLGLFRATQASRGSLQDGRLVPVEYREDRTGRPGVRTTIDWSAGRVSFSRGPDRSTGQAPTQPLLQDRLSLLLQIGMEMRARPLDPSIELPVAGARSVSQQKLERRGEETISVPLGSVVTVKYERPMDPDDDRIEVWLAPSLCWLPVRIRYSDHKGGVIDHRLRAAASD
jgi:hypothetical protein